MVNWCLIVVFQSNCQPHPLIIEVIDQCKDLLMHFFIKSFLWVVFCMIKICNVDINKLINFMISFLKHYNPILSLCVSVYYWQWISVVKSRNLHRLTKQTHQRPFHQSSRKLKWIIQFAPNPPLKKYMQMTILANRSKIFLILCLVPENNFIIYYTKLRKFFPSYQRKKAHSVWSEWIWMWKSWASIWMDPSDSDCCWRGGRWGGWGGW